MVPAQPNDEFYVGYLPQAPPRMAGRVRKFVVTAMTAAALVACLLVIAQRPFPASFFEFLQPREFGGLLLAKPHPVLAVLRPGNAGELPAHSRYYLVGEGKSGIDEEAARFDGQIVSLRGQLIFREDQTMIEVVSGSLQTQHSAAETAPAPVPPTPAKSLGTFTLRGEIVDSKCFLGVMNPGDGKTHKGCAVRCIAGGSPPLFIVRGRAGSLLLLSAAGQSVHREILDHVARPVEIIGEIWQMDNVLALRADPLTYRILE